MTDSLCCPSRASIFSGRYPHDTGVFTNLLPDGGFSKFYSSGGESSTFATALESAGYRTAMMGKYLNGYEAQADVGPTYVPPGWSRWYVSDTGYPGYGYNLNINGTVNVYGTAQADYFTDVMANFGLSFVSESIALEQPFVIELASFAPHSPYEAAPRDIGRHATISAPRTPAFNAPSRNSEPQWLRDVTAMTEDDIAQIDADFRKRADSVLAIDTMIGNVRALLAATGHSEDTYVVFASDNGYHMGEHRLRPGKQTAFDTDINVPLIVVGPGVRPGRVIDAIVSNIDLCPTFVEIGGALPLANADGHSLLKILRGEVDDWRSVTLVEHHGPDAGASPASGNDDAAIAADPDYQIAPSAKPPTYSALRFAHAAYVQYDNGEREYYDLASDPDELQNLAPTLPETKLTALRAIMNSIVSCHDAAGCWAAQHAITP